MNPDFTIAKSLPVRQAGARRAEPDPSLTGRFRVNPIFCFVSFCASVSDEKFESNAKFGFKTTRVNCVKLKKNLKTKRDASFHQKRPLYFYSRIFILWKQL